MSSFGMLRVHGVSVGVAIVNMDVFKRCLRNERHSRVVFGDRPFVVEPGVPIGPHGAVVRLRVHADSVSYVALGGEVHEAWLAFDEWHEGGDLAAEGIKWVLFEDGEEE